MKKKTLIYAVAAIVIAALASFLAGCGFVSYESGNDDDTAIYELRIQYIDRIRSETDIENYRAQEQKIYVYALNDAVNELNECTDEAELVSVYEKHSEILSGIKTDSEYKEEEAIAEAERQRREFEEYKAATADKIRDYADVNLYRAEQRALIDEYMTDACRKIELADKKSEIDNAYRDYVSAVYLLPTEEMLYNDELAELKSSLISALSDAYKLSMYRAEQADIVKSLIAQFTDHTTKANRKEDVLTEYIVTVGKLDAIKTDAQLLADERLELLQTLYENMLDAVEKNVEEGRKAEYITIAENVYADMCESVSMDRIRKYYYEFMQDVTIDGVMESIRQYNSNVAYRDAELEAVEAIKTAWLDMFSEETQLPEAREYLRQAQEEIDAIKTNDDYWAEAVEEFKAELHSLYGNAVLEEPRSLTEASSYYELANIIDYYAFYQKSATEFVCDTFSVKLNFAHDDAWTELVNVYWYCELIRTAVGIEAEFEYGDYFVVKLIPYDFAGITTASSEFNRLESAVEFDSDKSTMTARTADFDDFGYYEYGRTVNVWNSQQLWYALEHEYVPICAPGSPAECVMTRAKEILREIIMEGMSVEEKIFQIYTWFGKTGRYDWSYDEYFDSSDTDKLPEETFSKLRSVHAEGAILDGLGVCFSYAKANLLLLRLEGIDAYYVFARNNISDISYVRGGAGHGYNYIRIGDDWYMGDALRSFYQSPDYGEGISYFFYMLPANNYYNLYYNMISKVKSYLYKSIAASSTDWSAYDNLRVNNVGIFLKNSDVEDELTDIVNADFDLFSVFCQTQERGKMLELINSFGLYDISYILYNYSKDNYIEIYCSKKS